ncbi:purine permease [Streptomyces anulatus]|uniref:nucleobase:cation symporter-2 family protein n=1 Tax=Streptomyces TaxID=1883 RepID=UPI0008515A3E|nr:MULTISPECIES: nucleobase:cation symporter-2 family protein [Streptomyces]MBQ1116580.1 purine permease [Streptomyces sp. C3-3]MDQ0694894.1 xanthine permease [Streptomyces sp. W4I9-2]MDX3484041.1 nucleobase:cation symporter-2 family protein [Streptomyces sp. ID05-18]OKJ08871.1 uracil permease [Streptomyces sp. TSRI0261]QNQ33045.1 purine permease [Streptomyces sp. CB00271]
MAQPATGPAEGPCTTSPTTAADTAVHPVDEKLPPARLVPAALQHIAAMYAGVVTPPLIIGQAVGLDTAGMTRLIAASLLIAGLATILQTVGLGRFAGNRLPFVNAASSAGIAPMLAIAETSAPGHQLPAIYGAVLVAGVFCLAVGPFFGRLLRFFPPLVTGVVITLIGVTLMPVPVAWAQGGDATAADFGAMKYLALAAFTLVVILLIQRFGRGFLKQVALLMGMFVGTLAAIPFGLADFSALKSAPLAALPTPFAFGAPEFQPAAILSLCIVMLVLMTESSAGMLALGEICDRRTDGRTITRGLRTDGIATLLGPVFGGFPTSAFAQNVGVVSLTRVRSRYVVAAAGGALLILGAFPVLGAVVSLVPMPVLGGAGIVLFGSIAVSGIRTLSEAGLDDSSNIILVAVALGAGIIPLAAPTFYAGFPAWAQTVLGSGISAGALVAVVLNLFFHHLGTHSRTAVALKSS